jgi:hypothetical protein
LLQEEMRRQGGGTTILPLEQLPAE